MPSEELDDRSDIVQEFIELAVASAGHQQYLVSGVRGREHMEARDRHDAIVISMDAAIVRSTAGGPS